MAKSWSFNEQGAVAEIDINNKFVPYQDISVPSYTANTNFNWIANHRYQDNGWPSDHTFNVYDIELLEENQRNINDVDKKYVRYRINY